MTAIGVLEEVVDPLLLHEPAGEIEVGFTVLNAIIALIVGSRYLVRDVQSRKHLAENVRHREVLKDTAADFFRQQPKFGNQFGVEMHKMLVAGALAEPLDQPVEVALLPVEKAHLHGDVLTQDAVEADFVLRLNQEIELETEELRDGFVTSQAGQEQDIFAQWRRDCERPVRLCIVRHNIPSLR